MDIFTFATALVQATIGCAIVFFILNFLRQKQRDIVTFEIKNLEAKMSSLRMILKAKVKKKSIFFRSSATSPIKQGDPFDLLANSLSDLVFETNADFEKYFTLSKQLNVFTQISSSKNEPVSIVPEVAAPSNPSSSEVRPDFMTIDVKNEFTILKIINEMVRLSSVLNAKIEHFNQSNLKTPLRQVEIIQFASMTDLHKIFSTQVTELQNIDELAS